MRLLGRVRGCGGGQRIIKGWEYGEYCIHPGECHHLFYSGLQPGKCHGAIRPKRLIDRNDGAKTTGVQEFDLRHFKDHITAPSGQAAKVLLELDCDTGIKPRILNMDNLSVVMVTGRKGHGMFSGNTIC